MTDTTTEPTDATGTEPTDYFAVWRSIKAGEKLQLLQALNIPENVLGQLGTAQMIAVAWKHRKNTTGRQKVADLLDATEEELLEVAGLTGDDYIAQIQAAFGAGDEDDEAPKSDAAV